MVLAAAFVPPAQADLPSGESPDGNDTVQQVLPLYLYQHNAVAHACAFAGLRPADRRAVADRPMCGSNCPDATTGATELFQRGH